MSKKFNCLRKIQDREFREKIAKDAFNAHRKITRCDYNPLSFEEQASIIAVSIFAVHLIKRIVHVDKEK